MKASDLPHRIQQTFESPAYWRGAAATRTALYHDDATLQNGRGIVRAQTIELKRAAGAPLAEISEFDEWMNIGARPAGERR